MLVGYTHSADFPVQDALEPTWDSAGFQDDRLAGRRVLQGGRWAGTEQGRDGAEPGQDDHRQSMRELVRHLDHRHPFEVREQRIDQDEVVAVTPDPRGRDRRAACEDIHCFYREAGKLAEMEPEERRAALEALMKVAPGTTAGRDSKNESSD